MNRVIMHKLRITYFVRIQRLARCLHNLRHTYIYNVVVCCYRYNNPNLPENERDLSLEKRKQRRKELEHEFYISKG